MSKHTPGPWKSQTLLSGSENDKGFRITADDGREFVWIADVSPVIDNERGDASEEGKANARLIAAAPALLEAAKTALAVGEIQFRTCVLSAQAHDQLTAAIAKAEGR